MTPAKRVILVVSLLFASTLPVSASGQQNSQGEASSDSTQTDFYRFYANSNPLGGDPEQTPTTIGPGNSNRCIPLNPAWQLVGQDGNTCYWYAPFPTPLNDYVVPMAKMSWVESTGGRCGQNPFSNPDSPDATAICDQPAPENNPYAPPPQTNETPEAPTDYYSENPYDPNRLLTAYKEIIAAASHGTPQQTSVQLGPQLQDDMTACSKYAAHGILSPACCTDLGQAANFNMEGTGPARQESKMYQQNADIVCQVTPPIQYTGPSPSQDEEKCGATLAAENARFEKVSAILQQEYQAAGDANYRVMKRITNEQVFHKNCVAELQSAVPAPPAAPRKPAGPGTIQKDGSYLFADTKGGFWSAPGTMYAMDGTLLRIDPSSFVIHNQGKVSQGDVTYRDPAGRGYVTGPAKPVGGNWTSK
jgi:hypothetical protein